VLVSADAEWSSVREVLEPAHVAESPVGAWFAADVGVPDLTGEVVFLHGGWGKIAAAASAQYAIDRWAPRLVVNIGTCGGFKGAIGRGDVVLADRTLVYDIAEAMGDPQAALDHYGTTLDLSWLAEPYPATVHRGLLVSGDRDIVPGELPRLRGIAGARAADWESGAIAYVAARKDALPDPARRDGPRRRGRRRRVGPEHAR
jgi:adenosylhomocysteine nucleosidase